MQGAHGGVQRSVLQAAGGAERGERGGESGDIHRRRGGGERGGKGGRRGGGQGHHCDVERHDDEYEPKAAGDSPEEGTAEVGGERG